MRRPRVIQPGEDVGTAVGVQGAAGVGENVEQGDVVPRVDQRDRIGGKQGLNLPIAAGGGGIEFKRHVASFKGGRGLVALGRKDIVTSGIGGWRQV